MDLKDENQKKSKNKVIIILALVLGIALAAVISYFVLANTDIEASIIKLFEKEGEYTSLLDEFVINLKSNSIGDHYLKMTIGLMYTKEKQVEILDANVSKIRDVVINNLRYRTYEEMLDNDNTKALKTELIKVINEALGQEVIMDIYITSIVIQ